MRADAARNRQTLLVAARQLFVEQGVDVPLDVVARAAGVGTATLYRRFPDRASLLSAVAQLSLAECRAVAEAGLRSLEETTAAADAEQAWQDLLQAVVRDWVGPYLLTLVRSTALLDDPALDEARRGTLGAIDRLVDALRARGVLRGDVTSFEVWSLLLAVARPLPGVPGSHAAPLVQRHLQVVVAGLRPTGAALSGVPVTQRDAEAAATRLAAGPVEGQAAAAR
ncbi:TetR/AcrR family transcriptional regulator [Blastococcus sp. CCUG 61487]|uniref:TetR/AcrR family transcriptional regulator n=1 Tax=Blastococcus sp. CCUG 61487 TaxID=1840703 RepID=UPI0010C107D8|nr:TetR/AcrR family transcriptional regulator [Blastococcus sp. CCUG 61487]TKJ35168.1 hypothetical protein A6V29_14470 [Blastococcus sp. CCUG 61487]